MKNCLSDHLRDQLFLKEFTEEEYHVEPSSIMAINDGFMLLGQLIKEPFDEGSHGVSSYNFFIDGGVFKVALCKSCGPVIAADAAPRPIV